MDSVATTDIETNQNTNDDICKKEHSIANEDIKEDEKVTEDINTSETLKTTTIDIVESNNSNPPQSTIKDAIDLNTTEDVESLTTEKFVLHKFEPIDPEKESEIEYIKLQTPFRVSAVILIVYLVVWIIMILNAIIQHEKREGTIKFGFCDGIYSCFPWIDLLLESSDVLSHCNTWCDANPEDSALKRARARQCWDESLPNAINPIFGVKGWCASFNNQSSAIFWGQLCLLVIILFWCWKLLQKAWKGIRLPSLEKGDDQKGFKKVMKKIRQFSDKIYDLKINIRKLVELYTKCVGNHKIQDNDDMEHDEFLKLIGNATYVLYALNTLFLEMPFQLFNIASTSLLLKALGFATIVGYMIDLGFIVYSRSSTYKKLMKKAEAYPPRNFKFVLNLLSGNTTKQLNRFAEPTITILFATMATPNSNYDCWMRIINIIKGIYKFVSASGEFIFLFVIVLSYYQKNSVSRRESLLLRDNWKKLFAWSVFKFKITDQDKFVYVDDNRASAQMIVWDKEHDKGCSPSPGYAQMIVGLSFLVPVFLFLLIGVTVIIQ